MWVILVIFGIIWIITKASDGASDVNSSMKNKQAFNDERNKKYANRQIDTTETLFDRNKDIIELFELSIIAHPSSSGYGYRSQYNSASYYIDNRTRDCINEITLAEGNIAVYPNSTYLSDWKNKAPAEWVALSDQIKKLFLQRQTELKNHEIRLQQERQRVEKEKRAAQQEIEKERGRIANEIKLLSSKKQQRVDPLLIRKTKYRNAYGPILIEQITSILTPNKASWSEKERELISLKEKSAIATYPLFETKKITRQVKELNDEIIGFNNLLEADNKVEMENGRFFLDIYNGYKSQKKEDVISRINFLLEDVDLPTSLPKIWNVDFDTEQAIAIVEIALPDVVHNPVFKTVQLKTGKTTKPLNQTEAKEVIPQIHPAVILRIAYEIYRNDNPNIIKLLVINGWVRFDDPATGLKTKTYTASLVVQKDQIKGLNLKKLEPLSAFSSLKGKSAGKLIDIIPVTPIMSLDRKDKRFIATKEVLGELDSQTNLASMDWQDFENLIAELFQKEFSEEGTEIKLTQSSRDKGVDAIVFNPDPIRGGKYVIQAKRYTNTVDVSAVRDLVAVVAHEGASRGILVTTSTFGADAYAFVQNKPITLLDGSKLLGLLEKHGYKFRVNLAEAKKLYPGNHKY